MHDLQQHPIEVIQVPFDRIHDTAAALSAQVFDQQIRDRLDSRLNETVLEFERRNKIGVVRQGNTYNYVLRANGTQETLTTTDATDKGLKEAQRQLDKLAADKATEIEQRYRVSIANQDEYIGKINVMAAQSSGIMDVYARAPRLAELVGLEAALNKSDPSKNDLQIYFVRDLYPRGWGVFAYYDKDPSGRPAIFLQPGVDDRPPTERDRPGQAFLSGSLDQQASLEALITHEIAHRGQLRMGWDQVSVVTDIAEKMGWKPYVSPRGETRYLLVSTEVDSAGNPRLYSNRGSWILSNQKGEAIDKVGKLVEPLDTVTVTNDEMLARTSVKPATSYFRDPIEMYAEALMFLRLGEQSRKDLLNRSPGLYDLVKGKDQEEIDKEYGAGKMIRSGSGKLVPDNPANRTATTSWETSVRD